MSITIRFLVFLFFSPIFFYSSNITPISANDFIAAADHVIREEQTINPYSVKSGDIIYLDTNYTEYFTAQVFPNLHSPYILITHGADYSVPGKIAYVLDDPKLIAWFAMNIENNIHPKLHHLPIGTCPSKPSNPISLISHIHAKRGQFEKKHLLYMNFSVLTWPKERKPVFNFFSQQSFCYTSQPKDFESFLDDLVSSKFVLSPRGTGIDCHRTWEALYLGTIPIVRSSSIDPLFKGLPVLIVKHWKEVTEEFLNQKYEEMQGGTYQWEKLDPQYWVEQIKTCQSRYKSQTSG